MIILYVYLGSVLINLVLSCLATLVESKSTPITITLGELLLISFFVLLGPFGSVIIAWTIIGSGVLKPVLNKTVISINRKEK